MKQEVIGSSPVRRPINAMLNIQTDFLEAFNALSPEWKIGVYLLGALASLFTIKKLVYNPCNGLSKITLSDEVKYNYVNVVAAYVLILVCFISLLCFNLWACDQYPSMEPHRITGVLTPSTDLPYTYIPLFLLGYLSLGICVMCCFIYTNKVTSNKDQRRRHR